jgi:hypothetical protein
MPAALPFASPADPGSFRGAPGTGVGDGAARPDPAASPTTPLTPLAHIVRRSFDTMQRHRTSTGMDIRLDKAIRAYDGRYNPDKLSMIRRMRGSEVYAKVTGSKCRGASALLKDVYLGSERPWTVNPTPNPKLPEDISQKVDELLQLELQAAGPEGQAQAVPRRQQLLTAAMRAARQRAADDARTATRMIDDLLTEGQFYEALGQFLTDLPIYPYAVLKGPVVEIKLDVVWQDGRAQETARPMLVWRRVSPYDFWYSPGVGRVEDGDTCERVLSPRHWLAAMRDVPGWRAEVIERILEDDPRGAMKRSWFFGYEQNRKDRENRDWDEDPNTFDLLCWHGWVQGKVLIEDGATAEELGTPDLNPTGMYMCEVWLAADDVLRRRILPWPAPTPPYYVTSYSKVPGSIPGHGVPDIMEDVQDILNACARALVNNMGLASGPQVAVNVDMLLPGEDLTAIFPWRVWPVTGQAGVTPIAFFQPDSRASELMAVYKEYLNVADEITGLPRYMTGSERTGGAGRTSSGLAMLMANASKGFQQVAKNVDGDVMTAALRRVYDVLMLTDVEGILRGDEELVVRGAAAAAQLETQRMRQIEFLQATANPIDLQIVGIDGRAAVLREVAGTIGLDREAIVPDQEEMRMRAGQAPGGPGGPPPGGPPGQEGPPGAAPGPAPNEDQGPRLNVAQSPGGMAARQ